MSGSGSLQPALEDLALVGDLETAALIARDGTVSWMCVPRFDSPAVFCGLLGDDDASSWTLRPTDTAATADRRYVGDGLVLETTWTTAGGCVRVLDFMPVREGHPRLVRVVEGVRGTVAMETVVRPRYHYGEVRPRLREVAQGAQVQGVVADCGPVAAELRWEGAVEPRADAEEAIVSASFDIDSDQRIAFVLCAYPSHGDGPAQVSADDLLRRTESYWKDWHEATGGAVVRPSARRSLSVLKALTHRPTGSILAAPTTSLPETAGGSNNWDYRYAWLRDATFVVDALVTSGHLDEARAWRDWLLRSVAGDPHRLQVLYGLSGERHIQEWEVPWLEGYRGARPVRVGNRAQTQFQLDVLGEVVSVLHHGRRLGIEDDADGATWALECELADHVVEVWRRPDQGLWESRGEPRHHVHSKVLAWVALDRAIEDARTLGVDAPVDRWYEAREAIAAEVATRGFDEKRNTFTRVYDDPDVDAALLRIPLVGFLPWDDPRVAGTVDAVVGDLSDGTGLVRRHADSSSAGKEDSAFLACSFWLVQCLAGLGRTEQARRTFERLEACANDLGLLAEEYDGDRGVLMGNFPQSFSHVGLVVAAAALDRADADAGSGDHGQEDDA